MSLFRDTIRPPPIASDAAVRRYIDLIRAEIEPDPLFRRRLRGAVLNQFVAVREGAIPVAHAPSRAMGRLGRACLYASVAVAMSVGVTMAASQAALPGDPLYGVKLRIEALRVVALPAEFQDDLAVYALAERINELSRLAEAGRIAEAEAAAPVIEAQVAVVAAMGIAPEVENGLLASRLEVLDALVEELPPKAQQAIERAMAGPPGLTKEGRGPATGHGQATNAGGGRGQQAGGPAASEEPSEGGVKQPPQKAAKPTATPAPTATPKPSPTPKAKTGGAQGNGQDAEGGGQGE